MTEQQPHLWEVEHDYYGPEGSYWANHHQQGPYINRFDSWAEFTDGGSMSDALPGLNLLYRWDWHAWHIEYPDDYPDGKTGHELELFWMMPRKGIMARSVIAVTPDDELVVRAWLQPHAEYMQQLWAPLITAPASREDVPAAVKDLIEHAESREGALYCHVTTFELRHALGMDVADWPPLRQLRTTANHEAVPTGAASVIPTEEQDTK